jgi:hypothetical protein
VSFRDACDDSARIGGSWPEGTEVTVMQTGTGDCSGWMLVRASGTTSWVREGYLSTTAVPLVSNGGGGGGGSSSSGGSGGSTSAPQPTPKPPAATATSAAGGAFTDFEFRTVGGQPMLLSSVIGEAYLYGGDVGFYPLGLVSSSWTHPESICNPGGTYGSVTSSLSIRNPNSQYGAAAGGSLYDPEFNSNLSAYNPTATDPPRLVWDGEVVARVSKSTSLGGVIDPDVLLAHLGCG